MNFRLDQLKYLCIESLLSHNESKIGCRVSGIIDSMSGFSETLMDDDFSMDNVRPFFDHKII